MNMPDLADLDAFHRRRPRTQRYATVAAPSYLRQHGRPDHPNDLLRHACIRHRFASGLMLPWEYERDGQTIRIAPDGPLVSSMIDIGLRAALDGLGIIASFEEDLASALASGALEPVPPAWWASFSGPFLYYPSRTRCVHSSISSNGPGEGRRREWRSRVRRFGSHHGSPLCQPATVRYPVIVRIDTTVETRTTLEVTSASRR